MILYLPVSYALLMYSVLVACVLFHISFLGGGGHMSKAYKYRENIKSILKNALLMNMYVAC
jgi:hypothetical protein